MNKRAKIAGLLLVAGLGLGACAEDYGYSGVGYASYDGYGPYGYADAYDGGYYGWYDGYYYPGAGFYVYDRYRRPYRWNGAQQRYWQERLGGYRGQRGGPEWRGFDRRDSGRFADYGRQGGQRYGYAPQNGQGYRTEGDRRGYYGQGGQAYGYRGDPRGSGQSAQGERGSYAPQDGRAWYGNRGQGGQGGNPGYAPGTQGDRGGRGQYGQPRGQAHDHPRSDRDR